jgi:nucleoside-diphosphate-sugar epimerase
MISVTHVEDAARAHILAAQSNRCAGKAYFVNQDEPVSLWELVCTTLELVGVAPPTRKIPRALAISIASACEALWAAGKLKGEPFLTRYMVDELTLDHYYSNSRAAADLGYRPQITTETGRNTFVDWIRNTLLPRLNSKGKDGGCAT